MVCLCRLGPWEEAINVLCREDVLKLPHMHQASPAGEKTLFISAVCLREAEGERGRDRNREKGLEQGIGQTGVWTVTRK